VISYPQDCSMSIDEVQWKNRAVRGRRHIFCRGITHSKTQSETEFAGQAAAVIARVVSPRAYATSILKPKRFRTSLECAQAVGRLGDPPYITPLDSPAYRPFSGEGGQRARGETDGIFSQTDHVPLRRGQKQKRGRLVLAGLSQVLYPFWRMCRPS